MRAKNILHGVEPYEKAFRRACERERLTWAAEGDADGVRRRKLVPKSRVLRVDRDGPVAHTEIRHTLVIIAVAPKFQYLVVGYRLKLLYSTRYY